MPPLWASTIFFPGDPRAEPFRKWKSFRLPPGTPPFFSGFELDLKKLIVHCYAFELAHHILAQDAVDLLFPR